jgi:hypothetical protein
MEEQTIATGKGLKPGRTTVKRIRTDLLDGLKRINTDPNDAIEDFLKQKGIRKEPGFVTKEQCREIAREEAEEVVENAKRGYR